MKKNPLIQILKKLSKKEIREFRKWLLSPVFNQREDVTLLFNYLTKNGHLDEDKFLEKNRIYKKIFPKQPFDDAKMRQTIYFLQQNIENYLVYNELKNSPVRMQLALASVYRKLNMSKSYQKTIKKVKSLQEEAPHQNEHYLRSKYLLEKERYLFFENQQRNVKMNLQEVSDALDNTYLADKLKQSCLMLAHQRVFKTEYSPGLIQETLAFVKRNKLYNVPAIAVYYYGYLAFTSEDAAIHFNQLKKEIFTNGHVFPKSEIRDLYLMAINYCIGKGNAGEALFFKESFDFYKMGIDNNIFIENNTLSPWTFTNIFGNALKIGEYDWAYTFIHDYKDYLPEKERDSHFYLNLSYLLYAQKEYKQAMQLLVQTDFDDILLNLLGKGILLKIYFEEQEFDALDSLLESMRTYLHRKKVMGYHRANFQNVIKFTKKLVRVNPYNKEDKEKLKLEITNAHPLQQTEKKWMIEQLNTL